MADIGHLSPMESRVRSLEDVPLQRLVALERADWSEEAIAVALDELARRGLPALGEDDYLLEHPDDEVGQDGLCGHCAEDGLTPATWNPELLLLFGVRAIPTGDPCEVCRSRVVRLWWPLVPLIPLGRYRILPS